MLKYYVLCNDFIKPHNIEGGIMGGHSEMLACPCKDKKQAFERAKELLIDKDAKQIYVGVKIGENKYAVNAKEGIIRIDPFTKKKIGKAEKIIVQQVK